MKNPGFWFREKEGMGDFSSNDLSYVDERRSRNVRPFATTSVVMVQIRRNTGTDFVLTAQFVAYALPVDVCRPKGHQKNTSG